MSSRPLACAVFVSSLIRLTAASAYADHGDCGQPLTTGADPVASDCLFILRAAVNLDDCAHRIPRRESGYHLCRGRRERDLLVRRAPDLRLRGVTRP